MKSKYKTSLNAIVKIVIKTSDQREPNIALALMFFVKIRAKTKIEEKLKMVIISTRSPIKNERTVSLVVKSAKSRGYIK